MQVKIRHWSVRLGILAMAVLLLVGCAAGRSDFKAGEKALSQGDLDTAITSLQSAVDKAPDNHIYKLRLNDVRYQGSRIHHQQADLFFDQGNYAQARDEYRLAAELDGSNFAARESMVKAEKYMQAQTLVADAATFVKARRNLQARRAVDQALDLVEDFQPALKFKQALAKNEMTVIDGVELEVTSEQPITLNFTDTKLPDVFEILTGLSGINFILDEDIRNNKTTLFLEKATFAQALELLLRMNKLDKKILNSKTIVLFPKTRDKQKQFEDQLIQTFYLSNIDAKKAVNLLRTMLQVRKIYVHEELNAIVIRDTPGVIKLAQKIIEANDRGDAEVVFDLELIEVLHSDGLKIGPKLGAYQLQVGIDSSTPLTEVSNPDVTSNIGSVVVDSLNRYEFLYGLPSASFDLLKESGVGEVLANPKIRVKNKEKAKVHIGTREPVVTVTINDTQTSENVQYVDVGVKLDVEPSIQLDNTVVTKLGLEVSNVSGRTTTTNGTAVLTISTTNANTALTLKDGETTVIGGLLRDSESKSKTSVPILGDIPLLGALFTNYTKSNTKSEILLSITPHIVRSVTVPERKVSSIWSGGEDDLKDGRNFGTFADDYATGQKGLEAELPDMDLAVDIQQDSVAPEETGQGAESQQPVTSEGVAPQPVSVSPTDAALQGAVESDPPIKEELVDPADMPASMEQALIYILGSELVNLGEEFSLVFYVDEIKNLFSAPLYVNYDQSLFDFVGATEGGFLKGTNAQTIFTHTALADSGRVIVGLKQGAGGKGVSGGGELFVMTFKAKAKGKGLIEPARTNFRNPQGERLDVHMIGLEIEVQ